MGWKELPLWIKSGIIAFAINLFLIFIVIAFNPSLSFESWTMILIILQLAFVQEFFHSQGLTSLILISSIGAFVLGVFIGWVVGVIKKVR